MMENLTHFETRIGPKRLKLVGIKNLWMVRALFEKSSIRPINYFTNITVSGL